ncbi:MAG: ketoacyl-ACP synthase III [Candidatus Eremiobacteraeota bacterium]|nr:ketoacyl-ACP synthase III [Candidatus Eremiobacteraeota bacterium]
MKGIRSVGITGVGSYAPEKVLTNFDLEKMVDTTDEWIVSRSGIRERHIASEEKSTSDLACDASIRAMKDAGVKPEDIDLIIMATVSPDKIVPSTACIVQGKLGCVNAGAFDVMAGCTGFIYALSVARQMVATGSNNTVLVIGADLLSKLTDWEDRNTCVLFGDGGGAAIVQPVEEGYGLIDHIVGAKGLGHLCIEIPAGGTFMPATHKSIDDRQHYIKMLGKEVFKFAVKTIEKTTVELAEKTGIPIDKIKLIVPHQANSRIMDAGKKRLKLADGVMYSNLEKYGNTSAGTIPLALADALADGKINKGDYVMLVGFGAGLTNGAIIMKWAYEVNQPEKRYAVRGAVQ